MLGRHLRLLYPTEQQRHHPEHELETARREGRYAEEGWRVRKDGSPYRAHVVITAVLDEDGQHIGFAKVIRDISRTAPTRQGPHIGE